jgi:hypothetical protein
LLAKLFAYIRRFTIHQEDRILIYCIIHFLTQRPLTDTNELKKSTIDYDQLRLFLISEQANYQDKNQQNIIEHLVSNAGLHHQLLTYFEIFFLGIVNEFDQK